MKALMTLRSRYRAGSFESFIRALFAVKDHHDDAETRELASRTLATIELFLEKVTA